MVGSGPVEFLTDVTSAIRQNSEKCSYLSIVHWDQEYANLAESMPHPGSANSIRWMAPPQAFPMRFRCTCVRISFLRDRGIRQKRTVFVGARYEHVSRDRDLYPRSGRGIHRARIM
jgi:hypothetical protein